MFRLWGKILKNNKIFNDQVFELDAPGMSLEEKITQGLDALCYHFDIQTPMWFNSNRNDLTMIGRTKFKDQHFMEDIDFDSFEIEIIENK